jgi:bleomycin hydrolase
MKTQTKPKSLMKKFFTAAAAALMIIGANAQDTATYHKFTDTKTVAATPVKDQNKSGTCWSFSALALMESELLRMNKGEYDLSPMWVARHTYFEKVVRYVRLHGKMELAGGGQWEDVVNVIRNYGIVPTSVYRGLNYGSDNHNHTELDALIKAYANSIIKGKVLTTAWQKGLDGILDAYFGEVPATFEYNGKKYTPESFRDMLGLDMDDYICLTSFTHHPFHTWFAIEVPDNWNDYHSYNVTMQELLDTTVGAVEKGYSVVWASDVSEPGFVYNSGIAFNVPEVIETQEGSEISKWADVKADKCKEIVKKMLEGPIAEHEYTQAERQLAFDNYETTDDHGMLITGLATDQDGHRYFKVKNSWTAGGVYGGYFYTSYPYFTYKTISVAMHRDALPKGMKVANHAK